MSTPRFWGFIRLNAKTELVRTMLSRSKQAPLHVTTGSVIRDAVVLNSVLDEFHRVQTLHVAVAVDTLATVKNAPATAPKLQQLSLSVALNGSTVHVPSSLFNTCHLPALSSLKITSYDVLWDSPVFARSLTHLTCRHNASGRDRARMSDVVKMLAGLPLLESLCMENTLPEPMQVSAPRTLPKPHTSASLLHLRSLDLREPVARCHDFIQAVEYPSKTKVVIDSSLSHDPSVDVDALSRYIAQRASRFDVDPTGAPQYLRVLSLHFLRKSTKLVGQNTIPSAADRTSSKKPNILRSPSVNINFCVASPTAGFAMLSVLDLSKVTVLCIKASGRVIWDRLAEASDRMPQVRGLAISSSTSNGLDKHIPSSLATASKSGSGETVIRVPFPHLQALSLKQVLFREDFEDEDDGVLSLYRRMLALRKDAGKMVETLVLESCANIGEDDLQRLRGLVGQVVCNLDEVTQVERSQSDYPYY